MPNVTKSDMKNLESIFDQQCKLNVDFIKIDRNDVEIEV
jgi:hypothetical protein